MHTLQIISNIPKNTSRNNESLLDSVQECHHQVLIDVMDALLYYHKIFEIVFVSQERIAQKTGYCLRTINWAVKKLHELGWIRKDYRHRKTCIYRINKLFYKVTEKIKHKFKALQRLSLENWFKKPDSSNCVPYILNNKDYLKTKNKEDIVPEIVPFRDTDNDWKCPYEQYIPQKLTDVPTDVSQIFGGESPKTNSSLPSHGYIDNPVLDNHKLGIINEETLPSATEQIRIDAANHFWAMFRELYGEQ
jgi:hypothetical protein